MKLIAFVLYLYTLLFHFAAATCDAPSPAYLLPTFNLHDPSFQSLTSKIVSVLHETIASNHRYSTTSFSLEITSQQSTLFSHHHTAKTRSTYFDGGANPVDNATRYRIASMTKPFVVLGILQLQKEGKLSLDDPVLKWLPELAEGGTGTLPWKDITLRALMSMQSGIPRDFAQDDFINDPEMAALLGLPELSHGELKDLPTCDEMVNYTRSCNVTDFTRYIKSLTPMFAPNAHPSYSNINFNLLGLVISTVSNTTFESYVSTNILQPLNMTQTTFTQPANKHAAMSPTDGAEIYWPFDMGIQNAAGGLYSTSSDLSKWLRYILSTYNAQTPALNWLSPASFSGSVRTFYGVPWEIYRVKVRDVVGSKGSTRPLSIVTKGGGLPGYSSNVIMIPDYAVGITILVVGDGSALSKIRDTVVRAMVTYSENLALKDLQHKYVGTYTDNDTKTKLVLAQSSQNGLYVKQWISNGSDTIEALSRRFVGHSGGKLMLRVAPTLLYVNETAQRGERWMALPAVEGGENEGRLFSEFCISDWEVARYAGRALNEVVFWSDEGKEGRETVKEVGLPGFRRRLTRVDRKSQGEDMTDVDGEEMLKVQG